MALRFVPALACAAWLTATTAMAQVSPSSSAPSAKPPPGQAEAPSTPVSPLIVQAPPVSRAVLEQQARGFVESYAAPTIKLGQFARWYDPACVLVSGLIPEQAAQFRARVEDVARAVGEPVAPSGCRPNIEIVFTAAPQRYINAAAARDADVLGYGGVKTITRPIQAWYATQTLGQPGLALDSDVHPYTPPPTDGFAMAHGGNTRERAQDTRGLSADRRCAETRSPTCPHSGFLNVLVIVDTGHMGDVGVGVTSDYIAMLALSQPRSLDGCMALPSVIDLYAGACPGRAAPSGLTTADMAYLTSLYAADLTVSKSSEQSDIAGRMVKILVKANMVASAGAESGSSPPADAKGP